MFSARRLVVVFGSCCLWAGTLADQRHLRHTPTTHSTIPDFYHPDILEELHDLCRAQRHIECFESNGIPYAVLTGVDPSVHDVVIALQHSRELIAGEVALHLLRKHAAQKPPHTLVLVPVVNICATKRVWAGEHSLRTSCSGIDLNRQYTDVRGAHKCEHHYNRNDGYQEFPGEQALSEPESKLVVDLLLKYKPRTFLNIHSARVCLLCSSPPLSTHLLTSTTG